MASTQLFVPPAVAVSRHRGDLTVPHLAEVDAPSEVLGRVCCVSTCSVTKPELVGGSSGPPRLDRTFGDRAQLGREAAPGPSNWNRHIGGNRSKNVSGANRSSRASKSEKQRWNSVLRRSAVSRSRVVGGDSVISKPPTGVLARGFADETTVRTPAEPGIAWMHHFADRFPWGKHPTATEARRSVRGAVRMRSRWPPRGSSRPASRRCSPGAGQPCAD